MRQRKGLRAYLLSSFFGAAMIAATYAYFNYKFSQFHFIDFDKHLFYSAQDIFVPHDDRYTVIVYSSKKDDLPALLPRVKEHHRFLALDLSGSRPAATDQITFITSGINTLLPVINRFNIYRVPVVFDIERVKDGNFKQASKIESFD
jgi:hypothetical protein